MVTPFIYFTWMVGTSYVFVLDTRTRRRGKEAGKEGGDRKFLSGIQKRGSIMLCKWGKYFNDVILMYCNGSCVLI